MKRASTWKPQVPPRARSMIGWKAGRMRHGSAKTVCNAAGQPAAGTAGLVPATVSAASGIGPGAASLEDVRIPVIAILAVCALTAQACGDDPQPPRVEPKVKLTLTSPPDGHTTRSETVSIEGAVAPAGAHVQVLGKDVAVQDGHFSAEVSLEPGANLIDVAATANGRRPDFAAMRLIREVRVPIPDVAGTDADTAQDQLEGLGLHVTQEDAGGFFDPILPGDPKVCSVRPNVGTQVLPGSDVTLQVARDC